MGNLTTTVGTFPIKIVKKFINKFPIKFLEKGLPEFVMELSIIANTAIKKLLIMIELRTGASEESDVESVEQSLEDFTTKAPTTKAPGAITFGNNFTEFFVLLDLDDICNM